MILEVSLFVKLIIYYTLNCRFRCKDSAYDFSIVMDTALMADTVWNGVMDNGLTMVYVQSTYMYI